MIYFIQGGTAGPIKIGFSHSPVERLRALQTSHHKKLRLLVAVDGTRELEAALHVHFVEKHLEWEWFDLSSEDVIDIVTNIIDGIFKTKREIKREEMSLKELAALLKTPRINFQRIKEAFGGKDTIFSTDLA